MAPEFEILTARVVGTHDDPTLAAAILDRLVHQAYLVGREMNECVYSGESDKKTDFIPSGGTL